MNIKYLNQVLLAAVIGASFLGYSPTGNAQAQRENHDQKQEEKDKKTDKVKQEIKIAREKSAKNSNAEPVQEARQAGKQQRRSVQEPTPRLQTEHRKAAQQTRAAQEQVKQQRVGNENQSEERRQAAQKTRAAQQALWQQREDSRSPVQAQQPQKPGLQRRIAPLQQKALIRQQQQRVTLYRQYASQRQSNSRQIGLQLQQQKRTSQYRYQQQYYERMRLQQLSYQNNRYDYNNDPYFYTASSYRYNRGGRYYETNQYGANILRQAMNYGYQEGMRAGHADQQDQWRYSYRDSYIYQDGNYGYNGYYVQQDDYNYYFRQGFQR
ncbi:MAG: hypothetical protein ACREO1_06485 [Arenimonas sp.]